MSVQDAFIATQNCYFHYEFEAFYADDFAEEISISLRGMMYRHEIQYPTVSYYLYYSDLLSGDELEKMKADFLRYCPMN